MMRNNFFNNFNFISNQNFLFLAKWLKISQAMLHIKLRYINENKSVTIKGIIVEIKNLILHGYFHRYEKKIKNNSNILCYYGFYNFRLDHKKIVDTFYDNFDNVDTLKATQCLEIRKKSFISMLRNLILFLIWFLQIIFKKCDLRLKLIMPLYALRAYLFLNQIKKAIKINKYSLLITYYDASFDDNILTQYFKYSHKTTATLQHGMFYPRILDNKLNLVEIAYSISDFFLCWNNLTIQRALSYGLEKKFIVCGYPRYINFIKPKNIHSKKHIFSIVLGTENEENLKLISIGEKYYIKYSLKYQIRLHPLINEKNIDTKSLTGFLQFEDRSLSTLMHSKKFLFTILGATSLYVDFLFIGHPTFIINSTESKILFNNLYNSFNNEDDVNNMFNNFKMNSNNIINICGPRNIKERYELFLRAESK